LRSQVKSSCLCLLISWHFISPKQAPAESKAKLVVEG